MLIFSNLSIEVDIIHFSTLTKMKAFFCAFWTVLEVKALTVQGVSVCAHMIMGTCLSVCVQSCKQECEHMYKAYSHTC